MKAIITISLVLIAAVSLVAYHSKNDAYTEIVSMSDKEYFDFIMVAGISLAAEEITNFQDSTVRFEVTASAFDTLGFMFPAKSIMSRKFHLIASQADIDSLKSNTVFNELMERSRAGHNFWFNN